jgi:thiamine pyridinylase
MGHVRAALSVAILVLGSLMVVNAAREPNANLRHSELGVLHQSDEKAGLLTVALYPYVPTGGWTHQVLREEWNKIHPGVKLDFVTDWSWDGGYKTTPSEACDIFEMDNLTLGYMVEKGYCEEIDYSRLESADELYEFAKEGCTVGGKKFAVPRLVCAPLLFYRNNDPEKSLIASAKSLADLFSVLGKRLDPDVTPELGEGLVTNELNSGTNCIAFYLDSQMDTGRHYSTTPQMPDLSKIDQSALSCVARLVQMAGLNHAEYENWKGLQARWFANGQGQVMLGWSERMHYVNPAELDELEVRTLPMSADNSVNLFYVDSLAIRKKGMSKEKLTLAYEFIDLCIRSGVVHECMIPRGNNPAYLLSANRVAMQALSADSDSPFYTKLKPLLEGDSEPKVFRLDAAAITWLNENDGANKDRFLKMVYDMARDLK